MKTVIEMAQECGINFHQAGWPELERLVELIRADERKQGQKWFDAVTAQHRQSILAEREACAGLCDRFANRMMSAEECADAIRARSKDEK